MLQDLIFPILTILNSQRPTPYPYRNNYAQQRENEAQGVYRKRPVNEQIQQIQKTRRCRALVYYVAQRARKRAVQSNTLRTTVPSPQTQAILPKVLLFRICDMVVQPPPI